MSVKPGVSLKLSVKVTRIRESADTLPRGFWGFTGKPWKTRNLAFWGGTERSQENRYLTSTEALASLYLSFVLSECESNSYVYYLT